MMRKHYIIVLVFSFTTFFAQRTSKQRPMDSINRWTIDLSTGQAKGLSPYTSGYYASSRNQFLGNPQINHFNVAARYMISPKFGLNFGLGYNVLKNNNESNSLPFEMRSARFNVQGVVNAMRLFDIQESMGRFGFLFHAGLDGTINKPEIGVNKDVTDYNAGVIFGVTPQFRISKKIAIFGDVSGVKYFRQHLNWDGNLSTKTQNFNGSLVTFALGMSFSLGKNNMHGDWAKVPSNNVNLKPLEERLSKMESMLKDSDNDGVADYLDVEKNSPDGAIVDTKGRTIDRDRNGIADELEKYLEGKGGSTASAIETTDMVAKFINDGYVAAYFNFNETSPTQISSQSLSLLISYLRNNPNQKISILGYADAIGDINYNKGLAEKRANNIKLTITKAGISSERLTIVAVGEDDSADEKSEIARSLVRRVTFKIN